MIMKLIYRLEKSKAFWYLLFLFTLFFLLRSPSLIEPHWYGDEGIYQVLGKAINQGRVLYSEIWDNKPPLLYITYALFNSDQFAVRFASLLSGIVATILLFFLSQKLFKNLHASIVTTILFTLLFATPYVEGNIANAENFMLLPVIAAAFLLFTLSTKQNVKYSSFFIAGLFLGVAFLFKIVALFDFAAFFLFLLFVYLPEKLSITKLKKLPLQTLGLVICGFLTPLVITVLWFASQNALTDFIRATFFGNIGYVGWGNNFIIPQGFLILKILILATTMMLLFLQRNRLTKPALFILIWLAFGLFNAFFSQRPYTHYVLVILPSICLLVGLLIAVKNTRLKISIAGILLTILILITTNFNFYPLGKTFLYYQNAFLFIAGGKDVPTYQAFFDRKTPRDYEVASFIKNNTKKADNVFIWGDSAQIYALADKLPLDKYTVAYHITQNKHAVSDLQARLDTTQPKYIIILAEAPKFPFRLSVYNGPLIINGTLIYEKNY